jgi:hypothetical protein
MQFGVLLRLFRRSLNIACFCFILLLSPAQQGDKSKIKQKQASKARRCKKRKKQIRRVKRNLLIPLPTYGGVLGF